MCYYVVCSIKTQINVDEGINTILISKYIKLGISKMTSKLVKYVKLTVKSLHPSIYVK